MDNDRFARGFGPEGALSAIGTRYGAYPPPGVGYGPAFGGGWGNWGGQVGQSFGPGSAGWGVAPDLTDDQILSLFYDALDNDPMIPHTADIDAIVQDRAITLAGNVRSKSVKRRAGEIAWALPGIKDVNNTITISGRAAQARGGSGSGDAKAQATSGTAGKTTRSRSASGAGSQPTR